MLISLCASGYARGQLSSFHCRSRAAARHGAGMNLFQAFGDTPPRAPTHPVSTFSSITARVTSHPCRLPAAAARQMCDANAGAAAALARDLHDHRRGDAALGSAYSGV